MGRVKRVGSGVDLLAQLEQLQSHQAKAGWFQEARYPDGTPVAYIASVHEFGSVKNKTPPRSVLRAAASENSQAWVSLVESGAKAVINGNASAQQVFEGLGQQAAGDARKVLSQIQEPAIAPETIKARQRKLAGGQKVGNLNKPLVETSVMLGTLRNETESK